MYNLLHINVINQHYMFSVFGMSHLLPAWGGGGEAVIFRGVGNTFGDVLGEGGLKIK